MRTAADINKSTHKGLSASPATVMGVLFLFVSLLSFSAFHFHPLRSAHTACAISTQNPSGENDTHSPETHCPVCEFKASLSQTTVATIFSFEALPNFSYNFYIEFDSRISSIRPVLPRLRAPPPFFG